jgi:uncharacterized protein (DUF1800 family)
MEPGIENNFSAGDFEAVAIGSDFRVSRKIGKQHSCVDLWDPRSHLGRTGGVRLENISRAVETFPSPVEFTLLMMTPLKPQEWNWSKAAHLLNRAGFGGSPEQIDALTQAGLDRAVTRMLSAPDDSAQFPKPAWAQPDTSLQMAVLRGSNPETMGADQQAARKLIFRQYQQGVHKQMLDLVGWWLNRMATTSDPLREKLTLFWHGHFATGVTKVRDSYKMWRQNETLRQLALGDFGSLVKAMSRDPAMLVWLDGGDSLRSKPNENWARELMELFTLGIGNYTEDDIKASAKAFTGYKLNPANQSFFFSKLQHNDEQKTFLGKTGDFNGDDVINLILQQPACAEFMVKKIWRFFVYEDPKPELIKPLAASFRQSGYAIRPLLNEIFRSEEFYSPRSIRMQIKSPVDWLVNNTKVLQTTLPPTVPAANALRQLGQMPFDPPNVKGWDGGKAWITTSTLLARYNLSNFILGSGGMAIQPMGKNKKSRPGHEVRSRANLDLALLAPAELRKNPEALVKSLSLRLFQTELIPYASQRFIDYLQPHQPDINDQTVLELLHLMMSTPDYQLT